MVSTDKDFAEVLDGAGFVSASPYEVDKMQETTDFYSLAWYPYRTDLRDNEIGFYLGTRVLVVMPKEWNKCPFQKT